ncbi:MAG: thiol:disulfide interchange protein, partial [Flavobacteriales bacterium]|nr:thiol:disulfide interchange protein [Flavobacteriales bacterium]
MNKFLAVLFTIFSFTINAQIFNPVSWDFSQKQISETEVELTFKASIDDHWHMYSQFIEDDIIATKFTFFYEGDTIVSKPSEGKSIEQYEPLWEMTLRYFEHEAIFKQRITVNSKSNIELGGYVDFMVCDESQCLPPDYSEFSFTIKGVEDVVEGKETLNFIQKKTEKTELEESNNKE